MPRVSRELRVSREQPAFKALRVRKERLALRERRDFRALPECKERQVHRA